MFEALFGSILSEFLNKSLELRQVNRWGILMTAVMLNLLKAVIFEEKQDSKRGLVKAISSSDSIKIVLVL